MSRRNGLAAAMAIVAVMSACDSITSPDDGADGDSARGAKQVTTKAEAMHVFALLKAAGEAVDRGVTVPFNGSTSVSGAAGRASVSGRKSASTSSTSTSTSTTRMTDLQIDFASFNSNASALTVSGKMRWFDYSYSRTACSSSTCASSSSRSESVTGTSIRVEFTFNGQRYSDTIDVDVDSPDYTSRWSGTVTTRAGQKFSVS